MFGPQEISLNDNYCCKYTKYRAHLYTRVYCMYGCVCKGTLHMPVTCTQSGEPSTVLTWLQLLGASSCACSVPRILLRILNTFVMHYTWHVICSVWQHFILTRELLSPFYTQGNGGSKSLNNFPQGDRTADWHSWAGTRLADTRHRLLSANHTARNKEGITYT